MKQTTLTIFVLVCFFPTLNLSAQSSTKKPLQFKQYPAVINCSGAMLDDLFNKKIGDKPVISFNGRMQLKGIVTNKISKFNNDLQIVVIQLPEFSNSIFSVSKRKEQSTVVYAGHLFNANFADGYQLKKSKSSDYEMVKISTEQVLQPCNY